MSKTSLMLDTFFPADADLLIHLDELDVLAEIIDPGHLPNKLNSEETSGKTSGKILAAVQQNMRITILDLAALIGIAERSVERKIQKLQNEGHLRRIGPAKGGHWEILE